MAMLEAAGILLAGILAGMFLSWYWPTRDAGPQEILPICVCNHGMNTHDLLAGACKVALKVDKYDTYGNHGGKQWVPCACQRYVGPQPPNSYYLPPPTDMDGAG